MKGAPLVARTRTAPGHRFFSLGARCPGLLPDPSSEIRIEGEVYEVPDEVLRDNLLPTEPPDLEFGIIKLEDGSACFSMIRAGIPTAVVPGGTGLMTTALEPMRAPSPTVKPPSTLAPALTTTPRPRVGWRLAPL